MSTRESLVIVAGHASFKDSVLDVPEDPASDEHWVLKPFQAGEPAYYLEHIRTGVELLRDTETGLLIFSGGRTRSESGEWSEASTYGAIADHFNYWGEDKSQDIASRVDQEIYARDSFENLQFSLYRFYRLIGTFPVHVMVVGWEFKKERFLLHSQALGISRRCFDYVGCNNPSDLSTAKAVEDETIQQFRDDPFGVNGQLLEKRAQRNPFNIQHPYVKMPEISVG